MKRKSPVAVKILACLLLLGSFAAFLLPWMKLSADVGPDKIRMNPGEIIQNFTGMDAAAVKSAARTGLDASGAQMDPTTLDDLLDRVLDGHFTLPGLAQLCRDTGSLCRAFQRPDLGRDLDLCHLVIWAIFGLLALLGLVALVCQLTDHRGGILPYFLFGSAVTACILWLRSQLNGYLAEQSQTLLDQFGVGSLVGLLGIDVEMVKMGIGAYLCPFLALLALLFMCIRKKQPEKSYAPTPYPARRAPEAPSPRAAAPAPVYAPKAAAPAPSALPRRETAASVGELPPTAQSWPCPYCGHRMAMDKAFCELCGTERPRLPALIYCSSCGAQLPSDAGFCFRCGAAVTREKPDPAPEQSPYPGENRG